ncbi:hypothetical protein GCM10007989_13380 [Devosia pacifica]|uniref:Uncharacterized protein n=2 Tax=Devosia pacifica TaxID=1335967 RepID=A0A918S1D5_9HYPH|nr:hypothetical protein GCM10007989_13380 [Devosia pacifica]
MRIGGDALVERRTLETLVSRLISEARLRGHPLTVDPAGFWPAWLGFINGNVMLEEAQDARRLSYPQEVESAMAASLAPIELYAASEPRETHAVSGLEPELSGESKLSKVRQAFLEQRRLADGDGRAEEDIGIVVQFLIDFLGDKPIGKTVAADFLRIENALPRVPHPHGVPKEHQVSLYARWRYAEENGWDGLKAISKTRLRNGWHRGLQAFFGWARDKGIYSGPEYVFRLTGKENREEQERDAWRPEEILSFSACRYSPAVRVLPIIGARQISCSKRTVLGVPADLFHWHAPLRNRQTAH